MLEIVKEIIENGLDNLKRDELVSLCEQLDCSKTGTKRTLKHRIYACYDAMLEHERKPDENINLNFNDPYIMDYVAKSKLNIIVARAIVRRIASAPSDENGNVRFNGFQACYDIVKSGWKDEILSDIEQDMYICMYELFNKGYLSIENGFIADFSYPSGWTIRTKDGVVRKGIKDEYIKDTDEIIEQTMRSIWSDFYRSVQRTLLSFRQADTDRAKSGNYVIVSDENGKQSLIGEKSTSYVNALIDMCNVPENVSDFVSKYNDVSGIEFSASLERFLKDFGEKYPKYSDNARKAISMILSGYRKYEIAENIGISRPTLNNLFMLMKTFYHIWDGQLVMLRTSDRKEYGCTYMNNDSSAYGSYEFCYGYLPKINSCDGVNFSDMFESIPAKTDFEIHCIKRYMYEHVLFAD